MSEHKTVREYLGKDVVNHDAIDGMGSSEGNRFHLVDDKWFLCPKHNCGICLSDSALDEFANGLIGLVLTTIDIAGLEPMQAKACKDMVKHTIHMEKESLELEMRRVVTSSDSPKYSPGEKLND